MKPIIILFAALFSVFAHAQNDEHKTPENKTIPASADPSGVDGKGKGYKYDRDGNKISHEAWEAQQQADRQKHCLKDCPPGQSVSTGTTQSSIDGKGKGYKYDRDGNKISHEVWEAEQEASRRNECLKNCQSGWTW